MQFSTLVAAAAALVSTASAKNILLTNDDGWASTGIRATYRELTKAGHNVYLVAPVEQRSGFAGQFNFPYTSTLLHDDQFHYKKAGDPAWGHEVDDDHIWYFNATPAACVGFAFDYLLPTYFANASIDLVVSGPNQGVNLDETLYTLSGTIGATYNSVYRGYPAIAFSGSNSNNSFFKDSLNDNPSDVQNIYAAKVVELVNTLFQGDNERVLPLATGMNVNFPYVSTDSKIGCVDPKFVFSRLSGQDILIPGLKYNQTANIFQWTYRNGTAATAAEYNGDFTLPSEDQVYNAGCYTPVSLFSVDYTAPIAQENEVKAIIAPLLTTL